MMDRCVSFPVITITGRRRGKKRKEKNMEFRKGGGKEKGMEA